MPDSTEPDEKNQPTGRRDFLVLLIPVLGAGVVILSFQEPALGLGALAGLLAMTAGLVSARGNPPKDEAQPLTWSPPSGRSNKVTYFDELVRINVENLDRYYRLVESQTGRSFTTAVATGLVGFALLAAGLAVGFSDQANAEAMSYVSSGAGLLTEFLAAVFFYLYRQTVRQLKDYHDALLAVQSVLLAFKAVEDLEEGPDKVEMLSKVIDHLMSSGSAIQANLSE